MSTYLNGGLLWGLLTTCLIFASFEIYSDITLGPHAFEGSTRPLRTATFGSRAAAHANPNSGYLVFYSEVNPKTNQRRDKLGFYMKQSGSDASFFGASDHDYRQGVTRALDDLFSSTQSMRKRLDASSPLVVGPL